MDTILYSWKSQEELSEDHPEKNFKYFGVKADQVADIFPELVYNEQEPYQLNYSELIPVLINAIKDLKAEKDELAQKVSQLETSLNTLLASS